MAAAATPRFLLVFHEVGRLGSFTAPAQVARRNAFWPLRLVGIFGLFTGSLLVVLSAFADSVWSSGSYGYSIYTMALGIGGVLGALVTARIRRPARLRDLAAVAGGLRIVMSPRRWRWVR
jgi:hypothetical protein